MSLPNRLVLPVILSSFAVLASCGGSSNPTVNPPPSGSFSNSNLSGTYVFSATGTDSGSSNFLTMMGMFTADGKGTISAGVIDVNGTAGSPLLEAGITSGSYNVGTDGRATGSPSIPTGLITLQSGTNVFTFDFVLTSSEHGLITEFDTFGSASGTLDLQSTVTQANINGQSYAFNLTGANGTATVLCGIPTAGSVTPFSTVGAFTLDANGNIGSGVADFNNNCVSSGSTDVSLTAGSVSLGSGTTFGKATFTTASAITYSFDVLAVDAKHLKFIETDAQPTLVGDAFTQASSIPTGNNVFTLAGFDVNPSAQGPFTAAGLIVTDGSGNITAGSTEDINDAGVALPSTGFTGSYTPLAGGRSEFTLSGFVNGNNRAACSHCLFAVYPSSGGLQILEIDDGGMTNGIAYTQNATTLASGEGYGMNLSGATSNSSEDDIAEFTNNHGSFGGIIDINDQGALTFKNPYSGTYAADTTVPGRGTVANTKNGPLLTTYVVDSSTTVAVSTDPNMVALGALVTQNSNAKSNAVANHLAVLRTTPASRMKLAKRKSAPTR